MFVYEYEPVEVALDGWTLTGGNTISLNGYRGIIEKRAKNGWRFVSCIPEKQCGAGYIDRVVLVFEKETADH